MDADNKDFFINTQSILRRMTKNMQACRKFDVFTLFPKQIAVYPYPPILSNSSGQGGSGFSSPQGRGAVIIFLVAKTAPSWKCSLYLQRVWYTSVKKRLNLDLFQFFSHQSQLDEARVPIWGQTRLKRIRSTGGQWLVWNPHSEGNNKRNKPSIST